MSGGLTGEQAKTQFCFFSGCLCCLLFVGNVVDVFVLKVGSQIGKQTSDSLFGLFPVRFFTGP